MSIKQINKSSEGRYIIVGDKKAIANGKVEFYDLQRKVAELIYAQGTPILKRYTMDPIDYVNPEGRITSHVSVGIDAENEYTILNEHIPAIDSYIVLYDNMNMIGEVSRIENKITISLNTTRQVNLFSSINIKTILLHATGDVCIDAIFTASEIQLIANSLITFQNISCDDLICQTTKTLTFEQGQADTKIEIKNKLSIKAKTFNQDSPIHSHQMTEIDVGSYQQKKPFIAENNCSITADQAWLQNDFNVSPVSKINMKFCQLSGARTFKFEAGPGYDCHIGIMTIDKESDLHLINGQLKGKKMTVCGHLHLTDTKCADFDSIYMHEASRHTAHQSEIQTNYLYIASSKVSTTHSTFDAVTQVIKPSVGQFTQQSLKAKFLTLGGHSDYLESTIRYDSTLLVEDNVKITKSDCQSTCPEKAVSTVTGDFSVIDSKIDMVKKLFIKELGHIKIQGEASSLAADCLNLTGRGELTVELNGSAVVNDILHQGARVTARHGSIKTKKGFLSSIGFESVAPIFLGKMTDDHPSHLAFETWYHPDICHYLLQMSPNKAQCLRVIFDDAVEEDNSEQFKLQVKNLVQLSNRLAKPAVFICKEPGPGDHYVIGVIDGRKLLLVNPLGHSLQSVCHQTLQSLKNNEIVSHVYFSSTVLQRREYEHEMLVSCGPISLELAIHFISQFTLQQITGLWDALPPEQHAVNIEALLPHNLKKLMTASKEDYINHIKSIRLNHGQLLTTLSRYHAKRLTISTKECLKHYLNESTHQTTFTALNTKSHTIDGIENLNEYQKLTVALNTSEEFTSDQCKIILDQAHLDVAEDLSVKDLDTNDSRITIGNALTATYGSKILARNTDTRVKGETFCLGSVELINSAFDLMGDVSVYGRLTTNTEHGGVSMLAVSGSLNIMHTGSVSHNHVLLVDKNCNNYGCLNSEVGAVMELGGTFSSFLGSQTVCYGNEIIADRISLDGVMMIKSIPKDKSPDGKAHKPVFTAKKEFTTAFSSLIAAGNDDACKHSVFLVRSPITRTNGEINVENAKFTGDQYYNRGRFNPYSCVLKMNKMGCTYTPITVAKMSIYMPKWENHSVVTVNSFLISRTIIEQTGILFFKSRDSKSTHRYGLNIPIIIPPNVNDVLTLRNIAYHAAMQAKELLPKDMANTATLALDTYYLAKDTLSGGHKIVTKLSRRFHSNYDENRNRFENFTNAVCDTPNHEWIRAIWEAKRNNRQRNKLHQQYTSNKDVQAWLSQPVGEMVSTARTAALTAYHQTSRETLMKGISQLSDAYRQLPTGAISAATYNQTKSFLLTALPNNQDESLLEVDYFGIGYNSQYSRFISFKIGYHLSLFSQTNATVMLNQGHDLSYQLSVNTDHLIAERASYTAVDLNLQATSTMNLDNRTTIHASQCVLDSPTLKDNSTIEFKRSLDVKSTDYTHGGIIHGDRLQITSQTGQQTGNVTTGSMYLAIDELSLVNAKMTSSGPITLVGNILTTTSSTLQVTGTQDENGKPVANTGLQLSYTNDIALDKNTKLQSDSNDIGLKAKNVKDDSQATFGGAYIAEADHYEHGGTVTGKHYQVTAASGDMHGSSEVETAYLEIDELPQTVPSQLAYGQGVGASYHISKSLHIDSNQTFTISQDLIKARPIDLSIAGSGIVVNTPLNSEYNLAFESKASMSLDHPASAVNLSFVSAGNITNNASQHAQQRLDVLPDGLFTNNQSGSLQGKEVLVGSNSVDLKGGSKITGTLIELHTMQGDQLIKGEVNGSECVKRIMDNTEANSVVRHEGSLHVEKPTKKAPKQDPNPGHVVIFRENPKNFNSRWKYIAKDSHGNIYTGYCHDLENAPDDHTIKKAYQHSHALDDNSMNKISAGIIKKHGLDQGAIHGGNGANHEGFGVLEKLGHAVYVGAGSVSASGYIQIEATSANVVPLSTSVKEKNVKPGKSWLQQVLHMDRKNLHKYEDVYQFEFTSHNGGILISTQGDCNITAAIFNSLQGYNIQAGGKAQFVEYIAKDSRRKTQKGRPGKKDKSSNEIAYLTQLTTVGYTTIHATGVINILGARLLTGGLSLTSLIAINISAPILKTTSLETFTTTRVLVAGYDVITIFDSFTQTAVNLFKRKDLPKEKWIKLWNELCQQEEMIGLIGDCLDSENIYEQVANGWNIGISGLNLLNTIAIGINEDKLTKALAHRYGWDELTIKVEVTQYKRKSMNHHVADDAGIFSTGEIKYTSPELNCSQGVIVHGHDQLFDVRRINSVAAEQSHKQTDTGHTISVGYTAEGVAIGIGFQRTSVRGYSYQNPSVTADSTMTFVGVESLTGEIAIQADQFEGHIERVELTSVRDTERQSRTQLSVNSALTECSVYRGTGYDKKILGGETSMRANDASQFSVGSADLTAAKMVVPGATMGSVHGRSLKVGKKYTGLGVSGNPKEIAAVFSKPPASAEDNSEQKDSKLFTNVKCAIDIDRTEGTQKAVVVGAQIGNVTGSVHTKDDDGLKTKRDLSFHTTVYVPLTNANRLNLAAENMTSAGKKILSAFSGKNPQPIAESTPEALPDFMISPEIEAGMQAIYDEFQDIKNQQYDIDVNNPELLKILNQPLSTRTQDLIKAGLEDSAVGMVFEGQTTNVDFSNLDTGDRLTYNIATLVGDYPVIIAAGSAAATLARFCRMSPMGWAITTIGGALMFSCPTLIRETRHAYHQYKLDHPDTDFSFSAFITTYGDDIAKSTLQSAMIGGAVGAAGKGAATALQKTKFFQNLSKTAPEATAPNASVMGTSAIVAETVVEKSAEAVAMATVPELTSGELPSSQSLTDTFLLMGVMHGVHAGKGYFASRIATEPTMSTAEPRPPKTMVTPNVQKIVESVKQQMKIDQRKPVFVPDATKTVEIIKSLPDVEVERVVRQLTKASPQQSTTEVVKYIKSHPEKFVEQLGGDNARFLNYLSDEAKSMIPGTTYIPGVMCGLPFYAKLEDTPMARSQILTAYSSNDATVASVLALTRRQARNSALQISFQDFNLIANQQSPVRQYSGYFAYGTTPQLININTHIEPGFMQSDAAIILAHESGHHFAYYTESNGCTFYKTQKQQLELFNAINEDELAITARILEVYESEPVSLKEELYSETSDENKLMQFMLKITQGYAVDNRAGELCAHLIQDGLDQNAYLRKAFSKTWEYLQRYIAEQSAEIKTTLQPLFTPDIAQNASPLLTDRRKIVDYKKNNTEKYGIEHYPPLFDNLQHDLTSPAPPFKRLSLQDIRNMNKDSKTYPLKYVILDHADGCELIITGQFSELMPLSEYELSNLPKYQPTPSNEYQDTIQISGQEYPYFIMRDSDGFAVYSPISYLPIGKVTLLTHECIAEQQSVVSSGNVFIKNGSIAKSGTHHTDVGINNFSGHYRPFGEQLQTIIETAFYNFGLHEALGCFNRKVAKRLADSPNPAGHKVNYRGRATEQLANRFFTQIEAQNTPVQPVQSVVAIPSPNVSAIAGSVKQEIHIRNRQPILMHEKLALEAIFQALPLEEIQRVIKKICPGITDKQAAQMAHKCKNSPEEVVSSISKSQFLTYLSHDALMSLPKATYLPDVESGIPFYATEVMRPIVKNAIKTACETGMPLVDVIVGQTRVDARKGKVKIIFRDLLSEGLHGSYLENETPRMITVSTNEVSIEKHTHLVHESSHHFASVTTGNALDFSETSAQKQRLLKCHAEDEADLTGILAKDISALSPDSFESRVHQFYRVLNTYPESMKLGEICTSLIADETTHNRFLKIAYPRMWSYLEEFVMKVDANNKRNQTPLFFANTNVNPITRIQMAVHANQDQSIGHHVYSHPAATVISRLSTVKPDQIERSVILSWDEHVRIAEQLHREKSSFIERWLGIGTPMTSFDTETTTSFAQKAFWKKRKIVPEKELKPIKIWDVNLVGPGLHGIFAKTKVKNEFSIKPNTMGSRHTVKDSI